MWRRVQLYVATLALLAVVATLVITTTKDIGGFTETDAAAVTMAAVLASAGATALSLLSLRRDQRVELKVALAGQPSAGKTAFANLLMNALMTGEDGSLEFVPAAKTAQAVIVAMRKLAEGSWPAATSEDGLQLYRGTLSQIDQRPLSRLAFGRREIYLEIADSPGEQWEAMARESRDRRPGSERTRSAKSRPLVESNFFEYVANADAIVYLIGADDLLTNPSRVRESVDDALETLQLVRSTRGRRGAGKPIRFVLGISKADLLNESAQSMLVMLADRDFEFYLDEDRVEGIASRAEFIGSMRQLERLVSIAPRLVEHFALIPNSSLAYATLVGLVTERDAARLARRHGLRIERVTGELGRSVTYPLRWIVRRSIGGPRQTV